AAPAAADTRQRDTRTTSARSRRPNRQASRTTDHGADPRAPAGALRRDRATDRHVEWRQPAEGCHRALAGAGLPRVAVRRADAWPRRRREGNVLFAAARIGVAGPWHRGCLQRPAGAHVAL